MEALLEASLRLAIPLLIAGLGELIVQRSGMINVGIEGMMLIGAFGGYVAWAATGSATFGFVVAIACAVCLGVVFAALCVWKGSDQIVVGMALNLLALGATGVGLDAFNVTLLGDSPNLTSSLSGSALDSIVAFPIFHEKNLSVFGVLLITLTITVFLSYTRTGLCLQAVGESAKVADTEGVSVLRVRVFAILFGAAMAGCAGAILTLTQTHAFTDGMTAGRGFIALAIVIFGRWHPVGVCLAALFFGFLSALQFRMQAAGWQLPYPILLLLPYAVTLVALGFSARGSRAPEDMGQAFRRT